MQIEIQSHEAAPPVSLRPTLTLAPAHMTAVRYIFITLYVFSHEILSKPNNAFEFHYILILRSQV